nr:hypothetical protein [Deltaproteobacteria bacterium]
DQESRLRFREVEVARIQGDEVLVTSGLADGETVIITPLKAVTDGMVVRVVGKPSAISRQQAAPRQARDRRAAGK